MTSVSPLPQTSGVTLSVSPPSWASHPSTVKRGRGGAGLKVHGGPGLQLATFYSQDGTQCLVHEADQKTFRNPGNVWPLPVLTFGDWI